MKFPGVGSTTSFQRGDESWRSSATERTRGGRGPDRYILGIHAQAKARRRRNATWLFVARISVGPTKRVDVTNASKIVRDAACQAKNSSMVTAEPLLHRRCSAGCLMLHASASGHCVGASTPRSATALGPGAGQEQQARQSHHPRSTISRTARPARSPTVRLDPGRNARRARERPLDVRCRLFC